jgi:acetyl-CoA carboxylase biotin carboxylase subunit
MNLRRITKVLVANRGEIAVRILRSCKELGLKTVAVYSDADRTMPHVQMADEAYRIGPPPSRDSYLRMGTLIDVALRARAQAIHPGYGFLSENAEFARRVRDAGLLFVGPTPESIKAMGDKTEARRLVLAAGVPTIPGTQDPIASESQARASCAALGFPVLLKAAAGGGGKGMRIVRTFDELSASLRAAQSEATSAFGDGRVYIEKYLENPRHIEFQILADGHGNAVHLGERECSIQRRHQKVVEESPSVIMTDDLRAQMGQTAVMAAKACGYVNAGTIEFLVDNDRSFYFLEMNTRLQVEHPVTELRTGLDLVALQLRIADGEPLPFRQEDIQFRGHAIECRICAEDIENDFLPSTGRIVHLYPPQGPGIREDRGVEAGGEVSVYYDPLISKLIVWAATREAARARMMRALEEYEILGVKTNIPLCRFVVSHDEFAAGRFDTHFLARHFGVDKLPTMTPKQREAVALVCAIVEGTSGSRAAKSVLGRTDSRESGWKSQRFLSFGDWT